MLLLWAPPSLKERGCQICIVTYFYSLQHLGDCEVMIARNSISFFAIE